MAIVGIDEVGRGCWAGPLVAAAVMLHRPIAGLKDSKQLSKRQRVHLHKIIYDNADIGLGWVSAQEIDRIGLTQAVSLAMSQALAGITDNYDEIIIDGNFNYLPKLPNVKTLVKADSLVPAVSAASIVAKVARDQYMKEVAVKFPVYKFEQHVGYGTKLHHELLKLHGVCELHRLSYKPIQELAA